MTTENETNKRLVTMADGSVMEFAVKAAKRTALNIDEGTVVFYLSTGQVFLLSATDVPGCSEYHTYPRMVKRFILDGIRTKIVISLNNTDTDNLGETIEDAITTLKEGRLRSSPAIKDIRLTREEKAYALLWKNHPTVFTEVQGTMVWDDIETAEVKADIISAWKEKSKKQRGAVKRNPWFMHYSAAMALDLPIEADPYLPETSHSDEVTN